MASPPENPSRSGSGTLLLDYLRELDKHRDGRKAVQIFISRLKPLNRRDHHVRMAATNFEGLAKDRQGQIFGLDNGDLLFIFRRQVEPAVQAAVEQVRFLFGDDPLIAEPRLASDPFVRWFEVDTEFDAILALVRETAEAGGAGAAPPPVEDTRSQLKARQEQGEPLTPEVLARVETALQRADLSNLVRRQFACSIGAQGLDEPIFSELFISIRDLRETLLPGINLASSRWLFNRLTQTLDRRMLAMLTKTDHLTISGDISFNVNVAVLIAPEFMAFDDAVPASRRGQLVVEIQMVDALSNLAAFAFARQFVQDRGYRVALDGVTHRTLRLVDRDRLAVDYVKLIWNPDLAGRDTAASTQTLIRRIGDGRTVLSRCDDRAAIDHGIDMGIGVFQGRQVETLIAEEGRKRDLRRLKRRIEGA